MTISVSLWFPRMALAAALGIGSAWAAPVAISPSTKPVPAKTGTPVSLPGESKSGLKKLPAVAVLSFTGAGMEAKDLAAVTNRFESELLATDSFKIVERRDIDKILREQGFQQSGACDNSECSVEIGQILSVGGIFTGDLSKTGKTWSLSVKRTDVATGQTIFSHVLDIQGSLEDVLRGGAPELALIASGRKKPENNHTVLVAKNSRISPWVWVAGGTVLVGGAVATALILSQDNKASDPPPREVAITLDTRVSP